jgi:hypothetical protein
MRKLATIAALGILTFASVAAATIDFHEEVVRVASWGSGSGASFIVEMTSYSPEADGQNTRVWWSIQRPLGVEQAKIEAPYWRAPKLVFKQKSTLVVEDLQKLRTRLVELNTQKPALRRAALWKAITSEQGIAALKSERCPKEIRAGVKAKRLILWSGTKEHDLGSSRLRTSCGEISYRVTSRACYAHDGGFLVRVRVQHGCEGDTYEDLLASVAAPQAGVMSTR